jgi:hypothetical protein
MKAPNTHPNSPPDPFNLLSSTLPPSSAPLSETPPPATAHSSIPCRRSEEEGISERLRRGPAARGPEARGYEPALLSHTKPHARAGARAHTHAHARAHANAERARATTRRKTGTCRQMNSQRVSSCLTVSDVMFTKTKGRRRTAVRQSFAVQPFCSWKSKLELELEQCSKKARVVSSGAIAPEQ